MSIVGTQRRKNLHETLRELFRMGRIPSVSDVLRADPFPYDGGNPVLDPLRQPARSVSDVDLFNDNLLDFLDDADVISTEQVMQNLEITKELFLSDLEFRKLIGDVKDIRQKAAEILLNNDFARSVGVYVSDDFTSVKYIDLTRTTAQVDIASSIIHLPVRFHEKADLSHLTSKDTPPGFRITGGDLSFRTIQGTKFGNLFDQNMSSWIIQAEVSKESQRVIFEFEIPLGNPASHDSADKIGREFNRLSITAQTKDAALSISYKNGSSPSFQELPIMSMNSSGDKVDYNIDLGRISGWSDSPQAVRHKNSHITSLRIRMIRTVADEIRGNRAIYNFVFSDVSLFRSVYRNDATMVSKSIPINPEHPTINNVGMSVFDFRPPLTSIDYYIAEDRYLPAYFIAPGTQYRTPGSPDITGVLVDTSWLNPETSGITQSQLREWAEGQGGFIHTDLSSADWQDWDPSWIKMNVFNEGPSSTDEDVGSRVVRFGNTNDIDSRKPESQPLWSDSSGNPPLSVGNVDFFRVADTFDEILEPTLTVRQGKNSWLRKRQTILSLRDTVGTGPLDGSLTNPTITAAGDVVAGSVRSVRTPTAETEEFYDGTGPNPDYFVEYSGTKIVVKRNVGSGSRIVNLQENDVKLRYTYREPVDITTWETFFYLKKGEKAGLNINMGGVQSNGARVLARDALTGVHTAVVTVGEDGKVNFHEIGDGFGWFQVKIQTINVPAGSSLEWKPVGDGGRVEVIGFPKQYAWMAPLQVVSFYELVRETNQEDHTKCAVFFPDSQDFYVETPGNRSSVWIGVNDPTSTGTNPDVITEIANEAIPGIFPLTGSGVFTSPSTVSEFFDVSYSAVGTTSDHLMVKIDLKTEDRNVTPVVDGYALRRIAV